VHDRSPAQLAAQVPIPRLLSPLASPVVGLSCHVCLSRFFIYVLDGLAFVIYAVINKYWPQHTGIEINALIGLVAFFGLAALASWKEVHSVDASVWLLKRMKISLFLSLILDAVQVALYGTSVPKDRTLVFPPMILHIGV